MSAVTVPLNVQELEETWQLPNKGRVGMICLIIGECAIFAMFVLAYVFYIGKSQWGPQPKDVLEVPIVNSVCLLSSSITIWLSEKAVEHGQIKKFCAWLGLTIALGSIFLAGTGYEWYKLIAHDGLTIQTNLFGTTFYSLVGLHASHVIIGLIMLITLWIFGMTGHISSKHSERIQTLALYWHFVDAVWVVVFTVVYVIGR
jgi:cytochrome c oxidase subunit 3